MLTALSRLPSGLGRTRQKLEEPHKILLIRPDHLGDVFFTTPALRLLRSAWPQTKITYMVGEWSKEIVKNNPNVDEVLTCPFPWFTRRPKTSLVAPYILLLREARRLRAYDFDLAINLRFDFWWGAMLAYYAAIPERVGYDIKECRPFLSRAIPYVSGRHEVEQNLFLAKECIGGERANVAEGDSALEFRTTPADEAFAEGRLASILCQRPIIAIHPGTGAAVKLWTSEGFAQVADTLAQCHGAQIVLTGSPAEENLLHEIANQMGHSPLIIADATLSQLAVVFRRCDLAVGVDSGAMHLAVAMGTPSAHLYGPVSDATFGPWGDRERHVVVKSDLPCIPCDRLDYGGQELDEHLCVKSISPEQVLGAAERLLAR
jgi:lipopolysaccharide heptosyltransferase II